MNQIDFNELFEATVERCRSVLAAKSAEYSTAGDRLHNFKVAAALQGETPREALGGMLAKPVVSIFDMVREDELASTEVWDEKIGDALNYLFLLKAIVEEERGEHFTGFMVVKDLPTGDFRERCIRCGATETVNRWKCCPPHTQHESTWVCDDCNEKCKLESRIDTLVGTQPLHIERFCNCCKIHELGYDGLWWQCCRGHCSSSEYDVLCESCASKLHPGGILRGTIVNRDGSRERRELLPTAYKEAIEPGNVIQDGK